MGIIMHHGAWKYGTYATYSFSGLGGTWSGHRTLIYPPQHNQTLFSPIYNSFKQHWKITRLYQNNTYLNTSYLNNQKFQLGLDIPSGGGFLGGNGYYTTTPAVILAYFNTKYSHVRNAIASFGCKIDQSYVELEPELTGNFYNTFHNHLFFRYTGEYNRGALKFKIFDKHQRQVNVFSIDNNIKDFGDNRYILDLSKLPKDYYILQVTNEKNENYYLRIKREL
jgi:hypothetical protein